MWRIILFVSLLTAAPALAETRLADLVFTNHKGASERWVMTTITTGDGVVRRYARTNGETFYTEAVQLSDKGVQKITVTDARPGGESMTIAVDGRQVRFSPPQGSAKQDTADHPLWTLSTFGVPLVAAMAQNAGLKRYFFSVPIAKAQKTVPMEARIVAVRDDAIDVSIRSTSTIVQTFFMRRVFTATLDRRTGSVLRYSGQPEAYDLSSGRARSVNVQYTTRAAQ